MGVIYLARNIINGKVYVGKTIRNLKTRKRWHFQDVKNGSTFYFHKAIRKYGKNAFDWEILEESDDNTFLCAKETEYIFKYNSNQRNFGYNLTNGGEGTSGRIVSEKTKQKMRDSHLGQKGHYFTQEKRKKISDQRIKSCKKDFPGGYYKEKQKKPWKRVWQSVISWKGRSHSLGYYNDPLSASIVYTLVKREIYKS